MNSARFELKKFVLKGQQEFTEVLNMMYIIVDIEFAHVTETALTIKITDLRCSKLEDILSSGVYDPSLQYHVGIPNLIGSALRPSKATERLGH